LCYYQEPGFWNAEWRDAQGNVESAQACFFIHEASRVDYVEHIHGDEAVSWWAARWTESDDDDDDDDRDSFHEKATTDIDWCIAAFFLVP